MAVKKFQLDVDLMKSDELQEILKKILSGMLPHDNYDPTKFGSILNATRKIILLTEMKMEFYVMFHIMSQIRKIQTQVKEYIPRITYDFISDHMSAQASSYVQNPKVGMKEWISESLNSSGDHIQTSAEFEEERVLRENVQRLYDRVIDLYDEAYEMQVSSDEALAHTLTLKEVFRAEVAKTSVQTQLKILNYGESSRGWEFHGAMGWENYMSRVLSTLRIRLDSKEMEVTVLDSLESVTEMTEEMLEMVIPLADYGYAPLDQSSGMRRKWMTVITANEGTGKTAWLVSDSVTLARQGYKVFYMCGESTKAQIFSRMVSSYIWQEHGLRFPPEVISKSDQLSEEHQRLVKNAMLEMTKYRDDGSIVFISTLNYWTLYEDLVALYEEHGFDAVMIDHSSSLKGGKELYTNIELLTNALIEFKKDYPVYIGVASHLSREAKELLQKGKNPDAGTTKGNSALSQGADMVIVLYANDDMKDKSIVSVLINKVRGNKSSLPKFVLRYLNEVAVFLYREEDQSKLRGYLEKSEQAIDDLTRKYAGNDNNEYEFDDEEEDDDDW